MHGVMQTAFAEYAGKLYPASPCHTETIGDVAKAIHFGGALLAWLDDVPVGSVRYYTRGDIFFVERVSVLPGFRGLGIASAMMDELERLARRNGCSQMQLHSRLNLPKNIALYERMGFAIVSQHQITADADIQVTMTKCLEKPVLELA